MGDVDSDPAPAELLGRRDGRSASAEGVQNGGSLAAAGPDDPLQLGDRLLGGIGEALGLACRADVRPDVLQGLPRHLVQVPLVSRHPSLRVD